MAPAPPDRIFPQSGAGRPSLEAAAGGPGRSQLCADEGSPSPQRLPASFPRLTQARGLSSPRHPSPEVSPVWQHLPLKRWLLPRQVSDESHKSVLEELLPGAFLSLGHVSDPGQDTSTSPAPQSLPRVSNASTAATQHRKPQPSSRNMLSGGRAVSLSQTKEGKLGKVKGWTKVTEPPGRGAGPGPVAQGCFPEPSSTGEPKSKRRQEELLGQRLWGGRGGPGRRPDPHDGGLGQPELHTGRGPAGQGAGGERQRLYLTNSHSTPSAA